jgi:hypothetical protein
MLKTEAAADRGRMKSPSPVEVVLIVLLSDLPPRRGDLLQGTTLLLGPGNFVRQTIAFLRKAPELF